MSMELVQRAFDEVWCRTGTVPREVRVSTVKSEARDVATVDPETWWACVREQVIFWRCFGTNPDDELVDDYAGRGGWRFRGVDVVT